jgi:hypothetical protein
MSTKPIKGEPFFYYFSGVLLITVVLAFSMNILLKNYHLNSSMILIIIHGISMLLWYFILFWQSRQVRVSNIKAHKQLGLMTIFLAITIVVSGIMIAISNYKGEREALTLFGNFSGMFVFGVLYVFALRFRHKSDIHKRLMIVASIAMLSPALVRILRIFDINDFVTLPFWLLYIAVLPIYDYRKLKKVQKATLLATGFLLMILFGGAPIGMSEGWANLMESIFIN